MPKYVFELAATLPANDSLGAIEAAAMSVVLANELRRWLHLTHHDDHEVTHEPPFEQVGGDFLPPDADGIVKLGESRPIDL